MIPYPYPPNYTVPVNDSGIFGQIRIDSRCGIQEKSGEFFYFSMLSASLIKGVEVRQTDPFRGSLELASFGESMSRFIYSSSFAFLSNLRWDLQASKC